MKKTLQILFALAITLATYTSQAQIRLVSVDPASGIITLQNFGVNPVDVSGYRFCHGSFNYTSTVANMLAISGTPSNFAPGLLVLSGATLSTGGSGLGLYLPGVSSADFGSAVMMVDFTQWVSGGNPRENVAVAKGIWTAGDFIVGSGPYLYNGNGTTDNGVTFWQTVTGVDEKDISKTIDIYPNPAIDVITINAENTKVTSIKIMNVLGEIVLTKNIISAQQKIAFNITKLPTGNYTLFIDSSEGIVTKKITITK